MSGLVVALVGAESTGKTTLARELAQRLCVAGRDAVVVPEYLRSWCEAEGRTPAPHEQRAIAERQTAHIREAAACHELVLADTTALMTAVYSHHLFDDQSLYAVADEAHAEVALTLLTGLDLAWVADGLQRDGAHVREPVDTLVRQALGRMQAAYAVVTGQGEARTALALSLIEHELERPRRQAEQSLRPRWRWVCADCDDGECEQHWLPRPAP